MMENEIKNFLTFYGNGYDWVMNNLDNLVSEAKIMLEKGEAKNAEHAAYRVIDERF